MAEGKTRRYSVDFEHFENAMLTEANLAWQLFQRDRWAMVPERRAKIVGMLKRFVGEMKEEIENQKKDMRQKVAAAAQDPATPNHVFLNGD